LLPPQHAKAPHRRVKRHHARPKKHKKVVPARTTTPKRPSVARRPANRARTALQLSGASSSSSSFVLPVFLGVALGLSLLAVALALSPSWALPHSMAALIYHRGNVVIYGGLVAALCISIAIGLVVS
jgi:hypothetical protein